MKLLSEELPELAFPPAGNLWPVEHILVTMGYHGPLVFLTSLPDETDRQKILLVIGGSVVECETLPVLITSVSSVSRRSVPSACLHIVPGSACHCSAAGT